MQEDPEGPFFRDPPMIGFWVGTSFVGTLLLVMTFAVHQWWVAVLWLLFLASVAYVIKDPLKDLIKGKKQ